MPNAVDCPSLDVDPYAPEALRDPYPLYERMREAGPVVFLSRYGVWGFARYEQVKATLQKAGLTMDDLVSVTIYCTDLSLYDKFNGIYRGYFHEHYPARAFLGVDKLVRGAHFEIQAIAVKK